MIRTALALILSAVAAQAAAVPMLQNGSFETNNITTTNFTSYKYAGSIVAAPWVFTGNTGVARDGSDLGGNTPSGNFNAFLQAVGSITQVFSSDGNYTLGFSFDLIDRTNWGSQNQVVQVLLDNVLYSSINATNSWSTFNISNIEIGAGNHSLTFKGTIPYSATTDNTTFLDNIRMSATVRQTETTVPEPHVLGLLGLGLAGLGFSRRRKGVGRVSAA